MGDMTAHFSRREFTCPCGCNTNNVSAELVNKLESIYEYLQKTPDSVSAIIVNSGCRCSRHSYSVGGYGNDAHTRGIAADIHAIKGDGTTPWGALEVAAVAEKLGFSGIGIITNNDLHVDIRNKDNYANSHWFGDERTGNDNIKSFLDYLPKQKTEQKQSTHIKLIIDGITVIDTNVPLKK